MKSILIGMLLVAPGWLAAQTTAPETDTPPTPAEKAEARILRVIGPVEQFGAFAGAGLEQWLDRPEEWKQGVVGYTKRLGAADVWLVTQNSIGFGMDSVLKLDPRYHHSHETGFWPRMKDAMEQNFWAYTDSGGRMVNYSEFVGAYGAGFISNLWYPRSANGVSGALERGSIGLAFNTMSNVGREFRPDLMRLFKTKVLREK